GFQVLSPFFELFGSSPHSFSGRHAKERHVVHLSCIGSTKRMGVVRKAEAFLLGLTGKLEGGQRLRRNSLFPIKEKRIAVAGCREEAIYRLHGQHARSLHFGLQIVHDLREFEHLGALGVSRKGGLVSLLPKLYGLSRHTEVTVEEHQVI